MVAHGVSRGGTLQSLQQPGGRHIKEGRGAIKVSPSGLRIGAAITVVADAVSVGSDAGSIRHDANFFAAPFLTSFP